jgi:hypothetical protein
MKKFLLGTTALIGAATLFATAAHAEGPAVTLGGFYNFQAGAVDQDLDTTGSATSGLSEYNAKFRNNTRVNVKVDGKADNGLGYGAVIQLQADVSGDGDNGGLNADRTYLFLESNAGRVELGSQVSPAKTMRVDASTFSHGTGGVDGDFYNFVNAGFANTSGAYGGGFITAPDLPLDGGDQTGTNATENATKVVYYTPRVGGFQAGVSYAPDSGNRGTAAGFTTGADVGQASNVIDAGVNYTGQFDQVGVAASATGSFGEAEAAGTEDLQAYAVGVNATFRGFTAGGSYGDVGDSLQLSSASGDGRFWDVGLGYEAGPVGVSVSYIDTKLNDNQFNNTVVGADYKLAPGLVPYVEVNFFDLDASTGPSNNGTAVLAGTQLTF